ncbi:MAG: 16S rRNA (cytidine(1402)-2'-O)-methyltransferase [Terriglobales bacterium]
MNGTLYVVATPIGNLEDITQRALRVLGEVDVIACEDTRHSSKLLGHYGIAKPLVSYYREKEAGRAAALLERLQAGENIALISDAGAPLLSDPGARLVAQAAAAGVRVVPVPGPSAPIAALMAAGAAGETPVVLAGFLPARAGERRRRLQELGAWRGSVVMFEAPHRLLAALADMEELWSGARPLVAARELTKLHEEFVRGTVASARQHFAEHPPRGEFTLVAGAPVSAEPSASAAPPPCDRAALKRWARAQGLSRSEAYRRLQSGYTGREPRR